jgi:hypothetical protein
MELKKEDAKLIYEGAPDKIKKKLESEFGPETFKKIDFKDLNSFEDLCKANGTTTTEFEAMLKDLPISQTLKTVAKLELLSDGINQGWMPDTLDTNQKKWFPVFNISSSGLDFSLSFYYYDHARAYVGFPFCFESEEKSNHAGKKFIKLWEELILHKID